MISGWSGGLLNGHRHIIRSLSKQEGDLFAINNILTQKHETQARLLSLMTS